MKLILLKTNIFKHFNIPGKEVRKTAAENSLIQKLLEDTGKITKTFYHRKSNYFSFYPPQKNTKT